MIEAVNKAIKHQFLYQHEIANSNQLHEILDQSVSIYNDIRPQMSLGGNTPEETFHGITIDFSKYSQDFNEHKAYRRQQNKKNTCKMCL
ncbi:integrase core domain-containing protein [Kordia sp.]|uniref:integrase core domain-containing protein n=1 Tax=Kordia sp. TaxID=1965332 RepID=UPI003D2D0133